MLDVLVVQDRLDCLLHFGGGDAFVVLGRALRHVQIELQDVVELVARVEITESLRDSRVLTRWSLHAHSGLRTLRARLDILEVRGVLDGPIAHVLVPLRDLLILAELLRRDQILNDHVLELELVGQLVDSVVHIVPLAIKILIDPLELAVGTLKRLPKLVQLVGLEVKFLLE